MSTQNTGVVETEENTNTTSSEMTPELVQLKDILVNNNFQDYHSRLDNEVNELENLFTRLRDHTNRLIDIQDGVAPTAKARLNTSAATQKRVSPTYIAAQVGNLVSIKTLKSNLLKQMNDLKQSELDRSFKIINQINKDNKESGSSELPLNTVINALISMNVKIPTKTDAIRVSDKEDYNKDVDEIFDILDQEGIEDIDTGNGTTKAENLKRTTQEDEDMLINEDLDVSTLDPEKYALYYDEENDELTVIDHEFNIVKHLDEDVEELEIEEDEEGNITVPKYNDLSLVVSSDLEDE